MCVCACMCVCVPVPGSVQGSGSLDYEGQGWVRAVGAVVGPSGPSRGQELGAGQAQDSWQERKARPAGSGRGPIPQAVIWDLPGPQVDREI